MSENYTGGYKSGILVCLCISVDICMSFHIFVFIGDQPRPPYSTNHYPLDYQSLLLSSIVYPFELVVSDITDFLRTQLSLINLGLHFLFELVAVESYLG